MKLSQKKTCNGCTAIDRGNARCELGIKLRNVGYKPPLFLSSYAPVGECLKPITIGDLFEARKIISGN